MGTLADEFDDFSEENHKYLCIYDIFYIHITLVNLTNYGISWLKVVAFSEISIRINGDDFLVSS